MAAHKRYVTPLTNATLPTPSRSGRSAKKPVVYYTYDRHGDFVELARQPSSRDVRSNETMLARQPSSRDLDRIEERLLGDLAAETACAGTDSDRAREQLALGIRA